jgi:hypothetical protein
LMAVRATHRSPKPSQRMLHLEIAVGNAHDWAADTTR